MNNLTKLRFVQQNAYELLERYNGRFVSIDDELNISVIDSVKVKDLLEDKSRFVIMCIYDNLMTSKLELEFSEKIRDVPGYNDERDGDVTAEEKNIKANEIAQAYANGINDLGAAIISRNIINSIEFHSIIDESVIKFMIDMIDTVVCNKEAAKKIAKKWMD